MYLKETRGSKKKNHRMRNVYREDATLSSLFLSSYGCHFLFEMYTNMEHKFWQRALQSSMGHDTALFCDFCWCISCTTTFIIWKWSQLFHRMWLRLCYLFPVVAEAPWVFVFEPPFQLLQNGTFELNPGQPVKCASIHPSRLWPGSDLSRLSQRLWPETQTLPHN